MFAWSAGVVARPRPISPPSPRPAPSIGIPTNHPTHKNPGEPRRDDPTVPEDQAAPRGAEAGGMSVRLLHRQVLPLLLAADRDAHDLGRLRRNPLVPGT